MTGSQDPIRMAEGIMLGDERRRLNIGAFVNEVMTNEIARLREIEFANAFVAHRKPAFVC